MRLYEIAPGQKQALELDISSIITLIKRECSFALNAMLSAKRMLYRGMLAYNLPEFIAMSRNDRRSLSRLDLAHNTFDLLINQYGFTANRSNSIFCTSIEHLAAGYGSVYYIFPVNGFDFLWSNRVSDLMANPSEVFYDLKDYSEKIELDPARASQEFIRKWKFKDTDFSNALISGNEILVHGKYYAFEKEKYKDLFLTNFAL